jgi:hypothetical protein
VPEEVQDHGYWRFFRQDVYLARQSVSFHKSGLNCSDSLIDTAISLGYINQDDLFRNRDELACVHWQVAQATSLSTMYFDMTACGEW